MNLTESFRSFGAKKNFPMISMPHYFSFTKFKQMYYDVLYGGGLGTSPPRSHFMFTTVNIRPTAKIQCTFEVGKRKVTRKVMWRHLTPAEQRKFFERFILHCMSPFMETFVSVFEFTKQGLVHMHLMCRTIHSEEEFRMLVRAQPLYKTLLCITRIWNAKTKKMEEVPLHAKLCHIFKPKNLLERCHYMYKDHQKNGESILPISSSKKIYDTGNPAIRPQALAPIEHTLSELQKLSSKYSIKKYARNNKSITRKKKEKGLVQDARINQVQILDKIS